MRFIPKTNSLHVGIFGNTNSGKTSLFNILSQANVKSKENIIFIDTQAFGNLSTVKEIENVDVALMLFSPQKKNYTTIQDKAFVFDFSAEESWLSCLKEFKIPFIPVFNKTDLLNINEIEQQTKLIESLTGISPTLISTKESKGIEKLIENILLETQKKEKHILLDETSCKRGDLIVFALPKYMTDTMKSQFSKEFYNLIIKGCTVISCEIENLEKTLSAFCEKPSLIVSNSEDSDYIQKNFNNSSLHIAIF